MILAGRRSVISRRVLLGGFAATVSLAVCGMASAGTIRLLTLVRLATGEVGRRVPFWRDGAPDQDGLAELNWLMRDVEVGQVQPIDLRVYYLLAVLQAEVGGRPISITSGYRTKATNERLREQGIDAARNSFHLRGCAADVNVRGVSSARIAVFGSLLGLGGVGLYRNFVHLDTGPRRFWTG
jgi:uncharacterized protein YcbK (DUF882 family)